MKFLSKFLRFIVYCTIYMLSHTQKNFQQKLWCFLTNWWQKSFLVIFYWSWIIDVEYSMLLIVSSSSFLERTTENHGKRFCHQFVRKHNNFCWKFFCVSPSRNVLRITPNTMWFQSVLSWHDSISPYSLKWKYVHSSHV